jgi:hypothetical protein
MKKRTRDETATRELALDELRKVGGGGCGCPGCGCACCRPPEKKMYHPMDGYIRSDDEGC